MHAYTHEHKHEHEHKHTHTHTHTHTQIKGLSLFINSDISNSCKKSENS